MENQNPLLQIEQTSDSIETLLQKVGTVFRVFDKQDSGCVSYGVEVDGEKWFVKYSDKGEAMQNMHNVIAFHSAVKSKHLPRWRHSFYTESGFALVYEWVEGECLSPPEFAGAAGKKNPLSPFYRFRQLPVASILEVLNAIYELHASIEKAGYVAVDFYAGSMIYDFHARRIHFCDFDHYVKGPFVLEQDRLPGSRTLMAPEEFVKGSRIDPITNVYTMGAVAFLFLGDSERSIGSWRASKPLFNVASKAASKNREDRYVSICEFYEDWSRALP